MSKKEQARKNVGGRVKVRKLPDRPVGLIQGN